MACHTTKLKSSPREGLSKRNKTGVVAADIIQADAQDLTACICSVPGVGTLPTAF